MFWRFIFMSLAKCFITPRQKTCFAKTNKKNEINVANYLNIKSLKNGGFCHKTLRGQKGKRKQEMLISEKPHRKSKTQQLFSYPRRNQTTRGTTNGGREKKPRHGPRHGPRGSRRGTSLGRFIDPVPIVPPTVSPAALRFTLYELKSDTGPGARPLMDRWGVK